MLVLGLETSCDETAAALVERGRRVVSNAVASQHELHAEYGGVVPEIASRAHVERLMPVVRASMSEGGVTLSDVGAVAVGHRPGLIGSLLVGVAAAKALAWSLGVPLVGIDHVHAHLYAACLDTDREIEHPALGLVVSGGHTTLYRVDGPTRLTRLGATIDDAVGEAFDKAATILGLPYPGGPELDRLASDPAADPTRFDLPISRLGRDSLDFSFSGLKTAVLYSVCGVPRPKREGGGFPRSVGDLAEEDRRDLAAAFQLAAVRTLTLKLGRALERGGYRSVVAGGGVTANSLLRAELARLAAERRLPLHLPPMAYCTDNAAMIAGLAFPMLEAGETADLTLTPVPTTAC